jgi:methylated-DNA-[protein]-cysteine S-methyltransferase
MDEASIVPSTPRRSSAPPRRTRTATRTAQDEATAKPAAELEERFVIFPTSLGDCGVAWRGAAVTRFRLPERDEATLAAELTARTGVRRLPLSRVASEAPWVAALIARVERHFLGARDGFADVPLDFTGVPAFHQRAYVLARTILPGKTRTYGELAARLGEPGAARAVGQAMGRNPFALIVPCHRVVAASEKPGGFSAHGGLRLKERMLQAEGVKMPNGKKPKTTWTQLELFDR